MKKKNVLILSPFFRPSVGGVETHLDDLCEYLRTHNYQVYVLTYQPITTKAKGKRIEREEGLEIRRYWWLGFNLFHRLAHYPVLNFIYLTPRLFMCTFCFLLLRRKKIDIIHAQGLNAAVIAKFMKIMFKKKVVMSTQALYNFRKGSLFSRVTRWTLFSLYKIIAESDESKKELMEIGIPKPKIAVFSHWVDQEQFKPRDKEKCKAKLGWQGKFIVLFVGRLIPIKGAATLLEVAQQTDPGISFAFIGAAGPQVELVGTAAHKRDNVIFVGKVDYQNLATYYNAADVFIIPSRYEEGVARVMLEALSCGTPVIGTKRGSIPTVLNSSVAILIEPTAEKFKETIEFLYHNPQELKRLAQNCRPYAESRFSLDNVKIIIDNY